MDNMKKTLSQKEIEIALMDRFTFDEAIEFYQWQIIQIELSRLA